MWKYTAHPNLIPLLGLTLKPLQLVSEWITGGYLTEYIKKHPDVDRLSLVGVLPVLFAPTLISATSCPMSPKALTTSTLATLFTAISKGYVLSSSPFHY